MNSRQKKYWQYLEPQVSRVLTQLDRRPFSSTFGCFDRKYWHQRITDFPSSSQQQGIEVLAHMYRREERKQKKAEYLQWIEAAVSFTEKIQKWDGSFDEWYFNERGWAGPTAYILNSLYSAYSLSGHYWQESTKQKLAVIFERASSCLANYEESDVLANHQALAMLALFQAQKLTSSQVSIDGYELIKRRFLSGLNQSEGWSLEYDGADAGYQTATISFLARLHEISKEEEVIQWVQPQLDFVSHFLYPDGSFARGLGSRSTSVVFFFGLEYWAKYSDVAKKMADELLDSLGEQKILGSHHQEDHYLLYRLPEIFRAMDVAEEFSELNISLPRDKKTLDVYFKKSGHRFLRKKNTLLIVDEKFGGRYLVWDCLQKKILSQSGDIFIQDRQKVLTSGHCEASTIVDEHGVRIETHFTKYKSPTFTPFKFISFRLAFGLLGFHPKMAKLFKKWIRHILMFSSQKSPHRLQRHFIWDDSKIQVNTRLLNVADGETVFSSSDTPSRYVPQTHYVYPFKRQTSSGVEEYSWNEEYSCVE